MNAHDAYQITCRAMNKRQEAQAAADRHKAEKAQRRREKELKKYQPGQSKWRKLMRLIRSAAADGKTEITLDYLLPEPVEGMLLENSFTITTGTRLKKQFLTGWGITIAPWDYIHCTRIEWKL